MLVINSYLSLSYILSEVIIVDMPILSGAMICEGGIAGSNLSFNKSGGNIVDIRSGRNSQFIKRQGVYFIRMNVPREQVNSEDEVFSGTKCIDGVFVKGHYTNGNFTADFNPGVGLNNGFVRPGQP